MTAFQLRLTPDSATTFKRTHYQSQHQLQSPRPTHARRGPKPKVATNKNASLIRIAVTQRLPFIEDAVMAALYIAVGSNNGTLNVRPVYVHRVLCMNVISTQSVLTAGFLNHDFEPISERQARYLAAAGRFALYGIERHLKRNPAVKARLQAQLECDARWCMDFDLGDYIASEANDPYVQQI